jgi:phosphotriesterase-related protein
MEEDLAGWMRRELTEGFQGLDFKAGFIKLSAGDDGMTEAEENILRAAITASKATNAVIGSHSVNAFVVEQQLAVMKELDFDPERFIWIHAQVDTLETNLKLAPLGLWIEYDHIDGTAEADAEIIRRMQALVAAGCEDKILLSMDRGWYDPAQPGGGTPQPWTLLGEVFLPKLKEAGFSDAQIHKFTVTNPFNAFAR